MVDELKCSLYIEVRAPLPPPNAVQWSRLINGDPEAEPDPIAGLKQKPLCAAIIAAVRSSQNEITINRLSIDGRKRFGDFEIDARDKTALIALLDSECARRGIGGNNRAQFEALLQAYCREVAIGLGYSEAQAANLYAVVVGIGDRYTCSSSAVTWMYDAIRVDNWEIGEI